MGHKLNGIVSNPNVAPHVKQTVLAYRDGGLLKQFYTTFIFHPDNLLSKLLSIVFPALISEFKRRAFTDLPYKYVSTSPFQEMLRVLASRKLSSIIADKIWEWSELRFDAWVASKLRSEDSFIHVTEHASLKTLEKAKSLRIPSFYEQPSIHHETFSNIVREQLESYSAFNTKEMSLFTDEKARKRNRRRDKELALADFIICNSSFTEQSLIKAGIPQQKIVVVPLGFPETEEILKTKKLNKRTTFLAAGNLSLGKGTHLLLDAWREQQNQLNDAELWIVGKNGLPNSFINQLPNNIKLMGNIPRHKLMELYHSVDLLIHPTLADGFGMVISEAMSCGTPVATTLNGAGADLIQHGQNGLLINVNNKKAISDCLIWCLHHRAELLELGKQAFLTAKLYPWSMYRANLQKQILKRVKH